MKIKQSSGASNEYDARYNNKINCYNLNITYQNKSVRGINIDKRNNK